MVRQCRFHSRAKYRRERTGGGNDPLARPGNRLIDTEKHFGHIGGNGYFRVLTPGHTPTNVSVYVPQDGALFVGIAWSMVIWRTWIAGQRSTGKSGSSLSIALRGLGRAWSCRGMARSRLETMLSGLLRLFARN